MEYLTTPGTDNTENLLVKLNKSVMMKQLN